MNKNYLELENKKAIVSDSKGNIKIVKKDNGNYNFEEILKVENKLEKKKKKLNNCRYKLKENELKCSLDKISSFMIIVMEALIFLLSIGFAGPIRIAITMIFSYLAVKILTNCLLASTKKERKKTSQQLKQNINELETEISLLKKELEKMKDKTNYQIIDNEKDIINISKKEKVYPNFLEENVEDKVKVKIKSFSKGENK